MKTSKLTKARYDFCFLLCSGYSRLSLTMMLEMLQEANRLRGDEKYNVILTSDSPRVLASQASQSVGFVEYSEKSGCLNGITPLEDLSLSDEFVALIVVGGSNLSLSCSAAEGDLMRRQQRRGGCLVATEAGIIPLAQTGLLKKRSVSCHVRHLQYLSDLYPDVSFNSNIFSCSGNVFSCAGGASTMDMMFELIERFTPAIYDELCVRMAVNQPRSGTVRQKDMIYQRYQGIGDGLTNAIELMEANIDEVLSIEDIATHSGVSRRQLERLFKRYLDLTPSQFYMHLRLKRARNRILNTTSPVLDIAFSCGFVAQAHFSRSYKAYFGVSPKKDRQQLTTTH